MIKSNLVFYFRFAIIGNGDHHQGAGAMGRGGHFGIAVCNVLNFLEPDTDF